MTALTWTYATLVAALQNWMDDTDSDWTQGSAPAVNTIIQLGELRLVNDFDLTVFDVSQNVTLTFPNPSGLVARPAALLFTDDLFYGIVGGPSAGKQIPLERRDYSWVADYRDPAVTGPPKYYAEADTTNWLIAPFPDQAYTLTALGPNVAQSLLDVAANATTWLSANLADVMLEACLCEVAKFLKNAGYLQTAEQAYDKKLGPNKVRLRALLRNVIESPRLVGSQRPEGSRPQHREE